jgi:DNA-binding transcriptional LysR family regulator
MINLSQLRAIVAVAEVGNFSEAALRLGLTQSTISHSIATLEEELGVPLFVRGRHGARLTPAGERITSYAREALQFIDRMQQEAQAQRSLQGGQVRIAVFRSVATHVLPAVIAQFHNRFPDVATTIVECGVHTDIEQILRDGRADIGFTYLPTSNEFEAWEILRDEYVVLFPPAAFPPPISNIPNPLTWEELAKLPLILPPEDQPCEIELYKHFETFAPSLNIAHKINQDSTIVSMVNQGLGVGILPLLAAEPLPSGIRIRSLPVPFERVIGAIILSNALHIPAVFAFLDLLKQAASAPENGTRRSPLQPQRQV